MLKTSNIKSTIFANERRKKYILYYRNFHGRKFSNLFVRALFLARAHSRTAGRRFSLFSRDDIIELVIENVKWPENMLINL